jgi:hypothetical protein
MIYLEEITAIAGGGKEAYLESVRTRWAPYAERTRGMRLVWLGSTIGSTAAWPETIALWELADWRHYADVCARMYTESTDDAELRAWWLEATKLRRRSRSRTLVAAQFSPSLDELVAQGVCGTAFAFSTLHVEPGAAAAVLASLQHTLPEEASQGRRLVGAYEVAYTNDLVCAIWAHATLGDLAQYESRRRAVPRFAGCVRWSEHWGFAAPHSPLWPKTLRDGAKVW